MTLTETIKSLEDINNLSSEKLKEVYEYLMMDEDDNWFAIMFITEECPHCKGEAHQFENYKKHYLQVRCFNKSCNYYGKVIDQFLKGDDFFRFHISYSLKIES